MNVKFFFKNNIIFRVFLHEILNFLCISVFDVSGSSETKRVLTNIRRMDSKVKLMFSASMRYAQCTTTKFI